MSVQTKKLTVEEFLELDLPGETTKYELIDGEIVEMNAPIPEHIELQSLLLKLFGPYELRHPEFRAITEPGLKLASRQMWIPDLMVLLSPEHGGRCIRLKKLYSGPPHIIVEVLSSKPLADLITKREAYEQAGIPEYWILSPEDGEALFLRLEGSTYRQVARLREGRYDTPHLPGFVLDVGALFREDLPSLVAALG